MKAISKRHKRTGQERCDTLSHVAGLLFEMDIRIRLTEGEAPKTKAKYLSFVKSLDGAIRHAQRQRDTEEREAGR